MRHIVFWCELNRVKLLGENTNTVWKKTEDLEVASKWGLRIKRNEKEYYVCLALTFHCLNWTQCLRVKVEAVCSFETSVST
jgi:hypothetical protein